MVRRRRQCLPSRIARRDGGHYRVGAAANRRRAALARGPPGRLFRRCARRGEVRRPRIKCGEIDLAPRNLKSTGRRRWFSGRRKVARRCPPFSSQGRRPDRRRETRVGEDAAGPDDSGASRAAVSTAFDGRRQGRPRLLDGSRAGGIVRSGSGRLCRAELGRPRRRRRIPARPGGIGASGRSGAFRAYVEAMDRRTPDSCAERAGLFAVGREIRMPAGGKTARRSKAFAGRRDAETLAGGPFGPLWQPPATHAAGQVAKLPRREVLKVENGSRENRRETGWGTKKITCGLWNCR